MSKSRDGKRVQVEDVEAAGEGTETAGYAGADPGMILERLPEMLSPRQRQALAEMGKGVPRLEDLALLRSGWGTRPPEFRPRGSRPGIRAARDSRPKIR